MNIFIFVSSLHNFKIIISKQLETKIGDSRENTRGGGGVGAAIGGVIAVLIVVAVVTVLVIALVWWRKR